MWIERAYKNEYSDSKKRGLRLVFRSGTDKQFRLHILSFAKWLRKRYWFPIRVEIRFLHSDEIRLDDGRSVLAVFNYQKNWDNVPTSDKACPLIYIATGKLRRQLQRHGWEETLYNYMFSIVHELTHYYQWYFYEFDKRSSRSLETEANSWAYALAGEYIKSVSVYFKSI